MEARQGDSAQHAGVWGTQPTLPVPRGLWSSLPSPCSALSMPTFQGLNFAGLCLPSAHWPSQMPSVHSTGVVVPSLPFPASVSKPLIALTVVTVGDGRFTGGRSEGFPEPLLSAPPRSRLVSLEPAFTLPRKEFKGWS